MDQKAKNRIEYYTVMFRTFEKSFITNLRSDPNAEWNIFVDYSGKFDTQSF